MQKDGGIKLIENLISWEDQDIRSKAEKIFIEYFEDN